MKHTTCRKLYAAMVVAGMAVAGPAQALDMNIWGVAHLSVDQVDNGDSGPTSISDTFVASNSSRLGFSGSQVLGDTGVNAVFRYESGVDLTGQGGNDGNGGPGNTSGSIFTNSRDSWLGLSGNFGQIVLGRVGGLNQWVYDYNLFADQVGDLGNIWGASGLAGRVSNSIQYTTPDMGNGLSGALVYSPDESSPDTDIFVIKGNAGFGDAKIGLGYMNQSTGPGTPEHEAFAVTASYSMGDITVGGGYQNESDRGGVAGSDGDSFTLGGSYDLGPGTVKAQWAAFSDDTAGLTNADATQWAIGYDHKMGKYATVYVAYATTDNDTNVAYTANNYGHGDAVSSFAGSDPDVFSIGVVLHFDKAL